MFGTIPAMNHELPVQRVAAKAVIESEDGILALHPSAIDANRNWHIPGGIRDDITEPLETTAVREVSEETGINISGLLGKVVKIGEWPAVDKGERVKILAVFFHYVLPKRPKIVLSDEHVGFAWLNTDNYKNVEANPEVYDIVETLFGSKTAT